MEMNYEEIRKVSELIIKGGLIFMVFSLALVFGLNGWEKGGVYFLISSILMILLGIILKYKGKILFETKVKGKRK